MRGWFFMHSMDAGSTMRGYGFGRMEAEVFAAYLLIPEDKLNEKLGKNGSGSLQTRFQSWQKNSKSQKTL